MVGCGMQGMKTNDDSHLTGATCLSMENDSGLVSDETKQSLCPKTQSQLQDTQTKRDQLWDAKPKQTMNEVTNEKCQLTTAFVCC